MLFRQPVYLILILAGIATQLHAQGYTFTNEVPVNINGRNLKAAWAGGLNSPQFSTIDFNQDGHLDLAVFERFDDEVLTFLNQGTQFMPDYHYAPEYEELFPDDLSVWMLLRDYNGDGYEDLFTSVPNANAVRVFRNNAPNNGGSTEFVLEVDTLMTIYPPMRALYVPRSDIPSIEDIDGDGDLDILSFDVGGAFIEYHRNTSFEDNGDLNSLSYTVDSRCYGHFRESGLGCNLQLGLPPCLPGNKQGDPGEDLGSSELRTGAHSGSTLLSLELNGDGNQDLLLGDISCNFLSALYGSDTSQVAHFDLWETDFPTYDTPVDIPVFPAMYYFDANNDGIKDLITAPNQNSLVEDKAGVWFHLNIGTDSTPVFQLEQVGYLQNEMIETGTGTAPVFFDHNSDGLQDLLVGNIGRYDTAGDYTPHLFLFENVGTLQNPAFELINDDYLQIGSQPGFNGVNYLAPALGDLDGDGDQDLLIGDDAGSLHYFRNNQNSSGIANFIFETNTFGNINADIFTHPELHDLDNDGDQDLLIGNIRGDIHYYENTGSATNPVFTFVTNSFGGIEITDFTGQSFTNGFARPIVIDYDLDNQLEVLVGTIEGPVEVYEDFSMAPGAIFTYSGNLFGSDFGRYSTLTAVQLDTSLAPTYVFGSGRGGLQMMQYAGPVSLPDPVAPQASEWQVFPNPAQEEVTLNLLNPTGKLEFEVHFIDALGRILLQKEFHSSQTKIDIRGIAEGMYWLVIQGNGESQHVKIMVSGLNP